MTTRRWMTACLASCLVLAASPSGAATTTPEEQAWQPLESYPWPESEISAMLDAIGPRQSLETPSRQWMQMRLAMLDFELGRYDEALTLVHPFTIDESSAPEVRAMAGVVWPLIASDVQAGKGDLGTAFSQRVLAARGLKASMPPQQWATLARLVKGRQFADALEVARLAATMDAEWTARSGSVKYPQDILLLLLYTLAPNGIEVVDGRLRIHKQQFEDLADLRPWTTATLRRATILSDELATLDLAVFGNAEVANAAKRTREASLLAARDKPDEALPLHRAAAAAFKRLKRDDLRCEALAGAIRDALAIGTIDVLAAETDDADELVALHERRMARMNASGSRYQVRHFEDYDLARELLIRISELSAQLPADAAADFRQQLVLLADRLQLRPARRQMAMLRMLATSTRDRPRLMSDIARANAALKQAADTLKRSQQQQGVSRDDLRSSDAAKVIELLDRANPGETIILESGEPSNGKSPVLEVGVYVELREAQQRILRTLDQAVHSDVGASGSASELPRDWASLTAGMDEQDAIVMFMERGKDSSLMAVVITRDGSRIVKLPDASLSEVTALARSATNAMAANANNAEPALRKLSRLVLQPLGPLPPSLTIVPDLALIGLPFETLTLGDGTVLIDRHSVRYALGLADGIGRRRPLATPDAAVVLGAVDFRRSKLDALADAGAEVAAIRDMLAHAGTHIEPAGPLPPDGSSLVTAAQGVTLVHVSTHSIHDTRNPLFDRLAFPEEDLMAIELALSSLDAQLVVFSACGLLTNRDNALQPVSGLATAALGTIAPELVTTLWSVESRGTRLFMLAFHEALLREHEAAAALADAKRLFRSASRLKEWAAKRGEVIDPQALGRPYYWSSFALVEGGSRPAAASKRH